MSGFTLIELMIVVAIIGILAMIAVPKFADLIRKSNEGATRGNLSGIRSALKVYYADMEGQYPDNIDVLTVGQKYLKALPDAKVPPYHPDSNAATTGGDEDDLTDVGGWIYGNDPAYADVFGDVYVNCGHTDTKGEEWASY